MTLYLVRHADALSVGGAITRDAERVLSPAGRETAILMGSVLARLDPAIRTVCCSPLVRAVETANALAGRFPQPPEVRPSENLAPAFAFQPLLDELLGALPGGSVVAVGHQPDMANFLSWLIAGAQTDIAMPMGAVACVTMAEDGSGAMLRWLLTPALARELLHNA